MVPKSTDFTTESVGGSSEMLMVIGAAADTGLSIA